MEIDNIAKDKTISNNKYKKSFKNNNEKILINKMRIYRQLYSLFLKNFFKTFSGPFYSFVLPLFFLILFYFTLDLNKGTKIETHGHEVIGGFILLAGVSSGFNFLSNRICEWKQSVFLKRLDTTPLKKLEFLFAIVTFYLFICTLSILWMLIWSLIINPKYQIENFKNYTNFGYLTLGAILCILISISLAIFIGGFSKSIAMGQGITLLVYFPSIFLSGMAVPIYVITNNGTNSVVNIMGYFIPLKYALSLFMYGWFNDVSSLNFPPSFHNPYIFSYDNYGFNYWWEALLGGIGYIFLLLALSLKTFKWTI